MQKRRPSNGSGAVLLGGIEHASPTQKRPILQANRAMKVRLGTLLFCQRWGVQQ